MPAELYTGHVERALGRLLEQFKGKPNLAYLLNFYIEEVQELEAVFIALLTERWLASAVGAQLDGLGRIVGQPRNGKGDDAYRIRLKAKIAINISSGTVEEILTIMKLILGSSRSYELKAYYPASFTLGVHGATTAADAVEAASILAQSADAGVDSQLIYSDLDDANVFTWASGDTLEASTTQGFGDDAQTTGGQMAGVEEA